MTTAVAIERTPDLIAAEINSIKSQTRMMVLCNSIEIGRRLVEVKSMLEHGQWGIWLEGSVDYSQSTANNLMRIFEEYGANQISLFGDNANSQTFGNLTYSQAVALLGVPAEEREQFVKDNDVENMSTRELQQAIKDRDEALKLNEELELKLKKVAKEAESNKNALNNVSQSYEKLEKTNHTHYEKAEQLRKELDETKKQLAEAQAAGNAEEVGHLTELMLKTDEELETVYKKIEKLELQLKEKPIDVPAVVEKIPEAVEKELAELRKNQNAAGLKFKVYFDELVKGFQALLGTLAEIPAEEQERYKKAVSGLIGKMAERR